MPRVHVLLNVGFDAGQPVGQRISFGQGRRGVVGEDAPALRALAGRQGEVVAFAGQLHAGRGSQHNRPAVDRRTAGQQIRVSEIGQEGQAHAGRHVQRGEEVVPEQVIAVAGVARGAQFKTGTGRLRRLPDEVAMAADVDEEGAALPAVYAVAGRGQKGQQQRAIQLSVQREDAVRGETASQQCLGHGAQVVVHGRFAGWGGGDEEGEGVGLHGYLLSSLDP